MKIQSLFLAAVLVVSLPAQTTKQPDPLHAWVGLKAASDLDAWAQSHIDEAKRLIAALLAVKGNRTPENTLDLYDQAQFHLTVAGNETGIMFSAHPQAAIRDAAQKLSQVVSSQTVALGLNHDVYEALAAIDRTNADAATRHYLDRILLEYRLGGVDKDVATRDTVRKLQDQLTEKGLKFARNIQDDVRKIEVKDKSELDGLPDDYVDRHKPGSNGIITLTTDSPDMSPVMTYAKSPKLRRAMFLAYEQRAYPANQQVLMDLLKLRHELANILGFTTWADFATADMMMGSESNMRTFLNQVDEASRPRAQKEFDRLKAFVVKQKPDALPLTSSDGAYWNEQYKRVKYAFNSQSVRPYFPYQQVEAGILKTAARLFHLEFRTVPDAPTWDPSVHAYDVYDVLNGGAKAGRIYLDMHPREGKDKWFFESSLIPGIRGRQLPESTLVCNFSGGTAGDPGLMQFDEVVTFFHEFGHMMHEVLGGRQRWAGQSGVTTEGDFVEAPSLMLEEMFHDPAIVQSFAKHYQTGETIPTDLIGRMNRASAYGRARWLQGQLVGSTFALELHNRKPEKINLDALLKDSFVRFSPLQFVEGDRDYASFTHLSNMSSNYYTYLLDKVIAVDFFAQFDKRNLLDGPAALRYRKAVLEPGGSKPAADLVRDFLGRPQSMEALKKWMDEEFVTPQ
jgi:thimet oligopeptidase